MRRVAKTSVRMLVLWFGAARERTRPISRRTYLRGSAAIGMPSRTRSARRCTTKPWALKYGLVGKLKLFNVDVVGGSKLDIAKHKQRRRWEGLESLESSKSGGRTLLNHAPFGR